MMYQLSETKASAHVAREQLSRVERSLPAAAKIYGTPAAEYFTRSARRFGVLDERASGAAEQHEALEAALQDSATVDAEIAKRRERIREIKAEIAELQRPRGELPGQIAAAVSVATAARNKASSAVQLAESDTKELLTRFLYDERTEALWLLERQVDALPRDMLELMPAAFLAIESPLLPKLEETIEPANERLLARAERPEGLPPHQPELFTVDDIVGLFRQRQVLIAKRLGVAFELGDAAPLPVKAAAGTEAAGRSKRSRSRGAASQSLPDTSRGSV